MNIPSKLIEEATEQLASLPGIGKRTALRLVLNLLQKTPEEVTRFANSFTELKSKVKYCGNCHNISDSEVCSICSNPKRDEKTVCVVEDIRDIMAIEATMQYKGQYHVLGGIISPMDGIGPADLTIESLVNKVTTGTVTEIILALPSTMEGDTTSFFIYKKLGKTGVSITSIAKGISVGNDLEYADEVTLGRSIINRIPYAGGAL